MNEDINEDINEATFKVTIIIVKVTIIIVTVIVIIGFLISISCSNKDRKQQHQKNIQEVSECLEKTNNKKRNLECHDYWEDRYNIRSQKDYEKLLIYVDYYVRQKNIIEGMFDDENLTQNIESWQIDYGSLYEDACFGCGNYKKRHEFLLKEVKSQAGCNHCY